MKEEEKLRIKKQFKSIKKPNYIPPEIISYTSEEIIEKIGPAMACSPDPCPISDF